MSCAKCPCPGECLGWEVFCAWAAVDPPDPVQIRTICERSALGAAPAYPPATVQAAGLARSLWDWAVSGFSMAGDELVARRRAICTACPEWVADEARCRRCGCATEAKIRLRTSRCPLPEPRW